MIGPKNPRVCVLHTRVGTGTGSPVQGLETLQVDDPRWLRLSKFMLYDMSRLYTNSLPFHESSS